jgi:adenosylcobinamide-GDP ribazoletransferase
MAATIYFGSMVLPYPVVIVLAIVVRLFITGALHEDGLADFLDGFGGGGSDRERILAIMKDSHIGTYGVLGLVVYELLLAATL